MNKVQYVNDYYKTSLYQKVPLRDFQHAHMNEFWENIETLLNKTHTVCTKISKLGYIARQGIRDSLHQVFSEITNVVIAEALSLVKVNVRSNKYETDGRNNVD